MTNNSQYSILSTWSAVQSTVRLREVSFALTLACGTREFDRTAFAVTCAARNTSPRRDQNEDVVSKLRRAAFDWLYIIFLKSD